MAGYFSLFLLALFMGPAVFALFAVYGILRVLKENKVHFRIADYYRHIRYEISTI